jgi:general stress protein 26
MYMDTGKEHYLSLSGHAEIVKDKAKTDELWNVFIKAWFEGGKDDPAITLIKVMPEEGHYWDTKNGKLVSMIKIAAAALTGSHSDGGVEGDITV